MEVLSNRDSERPQKRGFYRHGGSKIELFGQGRRIGAGVGCWSRVPKHLHTLSVWLTWNFSQSSVERPEKLLLRSFLSLSSFLSLMIRTMEIDTPKSSCVSTNMVRSTNDGKRLKTLSLSCYGWRSYEILHIFDKFQTFQSELSQLCDGMLVYLRLCECVDRG